MRTDNIPDAGEYTFGTEFNYDQWTQETQITLCNVPWNNDYRDVVSFSGDDALNSYIDSLTNTHAQISGASYAPVGMPIRISMPFNEAWRYNYLRARNPIQPVPGASIARDYYYFILDVRRIAPNTTEIVIELDVWQSFIRRVKLGRCYVERSHMSMAATNGFDLYGARYLSIPEPLDLGADTRILRSEIIPRTTDDIYYVWSSGTLRYTGASWWSVMYGDSDAPKSSVGKPGTIGSLSTGAELNIFTQTGFDELMGYLEKYPWAASTIISVTRGPRFREGLLGNSKNQYIGTNSYVEPYVSKVIQNWRTGSVLNDLTAKLGKYAKLKKFFTSPYLSIQITSYDGSDTILDPQLMQSADIEFAVLNVPVQPNPRTYIFPVGYNNFNPNTTGAILDTIYTFEGYNAVHAMDSWPQIPIISDNAAIAVANAQRSAAQARNAAAWTQSKSLAANANSFDNTKIGVNAASNATSLSNAAATQQQGIRNEQALVGSAYSGLVNAGTGAAMGGAVGAASGAVGGAASIGSSVINAGYNNQLTASSNQLNRRLTNNSNAATMSMAKNNKSMADWAARGDYAMTIAGIDAQVQSLQMTPPSMTANYGGEGAVAATYGRRARVNFRLIHDHAVRRIGDYWFRYGYAMNTFQTPPENFMCMSKFTYWKLSETYISQGEMPEFYKQAIRGIFEKGVTVWAKPEYIGNTALDDNEPLPKIVLV